MHKAAFLESNDSPRSFNWTTMNNYNKLRTFEVSFEGISDFTITEAKYNEEVILLLVETGDANYAAFVDAYIPYKAFSLQISERNYSAATFWENNIFAVKVSGEDVLWCMLKLEILKHYGEIHWHFLLEGIKNLHRPEIRGKTLHIYSSYENFSFSIAEIIDPTIKLKTIDPANPSNSNETIHQGSYGNHTGFIIGLYIVGLIIILLLVGIFIFLICIYCKSKGSNGVPGNEIDSVKQKLNPSNGAQSGNEPRSPQHIAPAVNL